MITELVLNVLFLLVMGIISIFPTFPTFNLEHFNGVVRVLSLIDTFVSLKVVASCIAIALVIYNLRLIWSVIVWAVRKLPFIN